MKIPIPVNSNPNVWTIFGATWCKYCVLAKEYIHTHNPEDTQCKFHDVDYYGGLRMLQDENLKSIIGNHKSIPIIFRGDTFVGGYHDLLKLKMKDDNFDEVITHVLDKTLASIQKE